MLMSDAQIRELAGDPAALQELVDDELPQPRTAPEQLTAIRYSLGRLAAHADRDPALLYLIAPDLEEMYQLAIPAAEAVDELASDPLIREA